MGIVLGGHSYDVPGVDVRSWLDDRTIKRVTKVTRRYGGARDVLALGAHTVHGTRGGLKPGGKASQRDVAYATYQTKPGGRSASWDFTVDTDGSVIWQNDPDEAFTWHLGSAMNNYTIGFEMVQDSDGTMYEDTLRAAGLLVAFLCRHYGIQFQTTLASGRVPRNDAHLPSRNLRGLFGHRNVYKRRPDGSYAALRGFGDPNDHLFLWMRDHHGFEVFDFAAGDDLKVWADRQRAWGLPADGVPGPGTRAYLRAQGYVDGIYALGKTP